MKFTAVAAALALLQSPLLVNLQTAALPQHMRFERELQVAPPGTGNACLVLDATELAHTASPAHSDLRIFRRLPGEPEAETPFTMTESGPEPVADTAAEIRNVHQHGNEVSLDLRMPSRPYSEVRLGVGLHDFIGSVAVRGVDERGVGHGLGRVAIFDLSGEGSGRWTSLELAETDLPLLHLQLAFRTPGGAPLDIVGGNTVQTAEVPPSRMRQTQYVPTVSTGQLQQRGQLTEALLRVPAHVPVERVGFTFDPAFSGSFAREVTVSARADGAPVTDTEALDAGILEHVNLPSGDPQLIPISLREDALDATLGATLEHPATVLVAINNDSKAPLPIRSVVLEMRERRMCFFADREGRYTLRYGDAALAPPAYAESPPVEGSETVLAVQQGPERVNPGFRTRQNRRGILHRFPDLYWLTVLFCGGMIGGTALHHVQHRRV